MKHKRDARANYRREWPAADYVHDFDIDIEKRDIFLFGREEAYAEAVEPGVDYRMANRFIKNLRILQAISDDPILIHMKTCGGDWEEGMAMYQAVRACPNHVTILNYTHARSMSSLIFLAADWRAMMPDSVFMFHDGTMVFDGTIRQMNTETTQANEQTERMMGLYLDACEDSEVFKHLSRAAVKAKLRYQMDKKEEVYLSADEAVAWGFADMVFGGDDNYDDFFARWIIDTDWRRDPDNAAFYLETAKMMVDSTKMTKHGTSYTDPFIYWVNKLKGSSPIRCLARDESFNLSGIELSMHGDQGPNGSRGSRENLRRVGVKSIIGHSHSPGIEEGCYQSGTSTPLKLEYNSGPSSWLQCHVVLYANGKRSLLPIIDGEWCFNEA